MGFTRYWNRTEKQITKDFVDTVKDIVAESQKDGIQIRDGEGTGTPVITTQGIFLNGDASNGLDYESFVLTNFGGGFDFCKTQGKPYDKVVARVLTEAEKCGLVTRVSSD